MIRKNICLQGYVNEDELIFHSSIIYSNTFSLIMALAAGPPASSEGRGCEIA